MNKEKINILNKGNTSFTKGLKEKIGYELTIDCNKTSKDDKFFVLNYIVDYMLDNDIIIDDNATISYYSWLIKLVKKSKGILEILELNSEGTEFIKGIFISTSVVKNQIIQCKKLNVNPIFPTFNQNIVISPGVYEGRTVEAVRYPSPSHMAGWWITSDIYNDDENSLLNVHYYHLAFQRPDLIYLLAIPFGYRFDTHANDIKIWFDKDTLED